MEVERRVDGWCVSRRSDRVPVGTVRLSLCGSRAKLDLVSKRLSRQLNAGMEISAEDMDALCLGWVSKRGLDPCGLYKDSVRSLVAGVRKLCDEAEPDLDAIRRQTAQILARAEAIGVEAIVITRSLHKFEDVKSTTTVVDAGGVTPGSG